jgi:hypothetical protein
MNDEELVRTLLKSALPRVDLPRPARDLWPAVMQRARVTPRWSLGDWSAAAIIVVALLLFPKWVWFVAYHL